jgi:phage-related protein
MVLPIISSLASVSSSISLISTGLTGISSIIGGLGGLLSGAFSAGLVAFDDFKTNVESFFSGLKDDIEDALNFDGLESEAESFFSGLKVSTVILTSLPH